MYWQRAVIFSGKPNFGMSLQEIDSKFSGREGRSKIKKKNVKRIPQFTNICRVLSKAFILRVFQIQLFVFSKSHEDWLYESDSNSSQNSEIQVSNQKCVVLLLGWTDTSYVCLRVAHISTWRSARILFEFLHDSLCTLTHLHYET